MTSRSRDPYQTLGVKANASDAQLRAAYRRLVQLHHPDHNGGSPEAARRFEEVQDAYARIRALRGTGTGSPGATTTGSKRAATGSPGATTTGSKRAATGSTGATTGSKRAATGSKGTASGSKGAATGSASRRRSQGRSDEPPPQTNFDPGVESRLADLERELLKAHVAREDARRAARRAAEDDVRRPTDEELGYFTTDDSFTKILDDAAAQLSNRFSQARKSPAARRLSDLIDDLGSKLTGEPPDHKR
jgi:curved DNA-binding protein CbpA